MADQHCRITVVGERRRVDLAVPAHAPIAEYVGNIAELCGSGSDDAFPVVWSLAVAGRAPFPLEASLEGAGVADGQVLYLRDAALGEADEPVVMDVAEEVERASERYARWAWGPRGRALTGLVVGSWALGALALALVLGVRRIPAGAGSALALAAGLLTVLTAAVARRRPSVPAGVCLAAAVAAGPEFAAAGALALGTGRPAHASAVAAAAGALLGSLACLAAVPGTATLSMPAAALAGVVLAAAVAALHADAAAAAGLAAVATLEIIRVLPWAVGRLAVLSPFERAGGEPGAGDPESLLDRLRQAWSLLAAWNAVLGAAATAGLLTLAAVAPARTSTGYLALGLAGSVSLALLLGASVYRQLSEAIPSALAGAAGLVALAVELPSKVPGPAWPYPLGGVAVGAGVLVASLAGAFGAAREAGSEPGRGLAANVAAPALRLASVVLLLGVFGVFAHLAHWGRGL